MTTGKLDLSEAFASIHDYWRPKVAGALNGQEVKLAKFKGEFIWHHHDEADELFLCIHGTMRVEFRDRTVELSPGQLLIVPRKTEHRTVAEEEAHVLIFEPAETRNTGNILHDTLTAPGGIPL